MITPINGHLLIKPLEHKTLLPSERETYEEVGTVIGVPRLWWLMFWRPQVKDKIFFDSWMAAKYPDPNNSDESVWLIPFQDIRAVQKDV